MMTARSSLTYVFGVASAMAMGCASPRAAAPVAQTAQITKIAPATRAFPGISAPVYNSDVKAVCDPPIGWVPEPLASSPRSTRRIWISPSGSTAYGVILIHLPFPVGQDFAMLGFLQEMKRFEGKADLISREDDPALPGLRFVVAGTLHYLRANLIVSGWEGWAWFAGTRMDRPINQAELDLAEIARDQTRVGAAASDRK